MIKDEIKFGHIICEEDLQPYIEDVVEGEPVVIKPNWANSLPASLSHFQALEKLLSCLGGKDLVVAESYSAWRNRLYRQHFLETGNIEWEENVKPHNAKKMWGWLKEEDEWFLDFFGFTKMFSKGNVEYVKITEEVWNKRTALPEKVRAFVGEKQALVKNTAFYGIVPERLMQLKGCTLLNFTKLYKTGIYAAKNMMGFIPDPNGGEYHRGENSNLIQTIHDINIIYRSLFNVVDVVESITEQKIILSGTNPAQLDEVGCVVLGTELADPYHDILKAKDVFGSYPDISLSDVPDFICEGIREGVKHKIF